MLVPEYPVDKDLRGSYTINGGEERILPSFSLVLDTDAARALGYPIPDIEGKSSGIIGTITIEDDRIMHSGVQLSGTAQAHIKTICQGRLNIYHRSKI